MKLVRVPEDFDCDGYNCPDCARKPYCVRHRGRFVGICAICGKWIIWGRDGTVSGYGWNPETDMVRCDECALSANCPQKGGS